jgi:hypothetical protein
VRTEKILPLPRVRFEFGQDRLTELHPLNPFEQYLTRLEKLDLRSAVGGTAIPPAWVETL